MNATILKKGQILKKGFCPSLEKPMETGDGLLVRLHMNGEVSAALARNIAQLSQQFGNGHIDLTSRGNLQFRGVTDKTYPLLSHALCALGVVETPRPQKTFATHSFLPLGMLAHNVLSLGIPFGRLTADMLQWLADTAEHHGDGDICLTPWRTVFLAGITKPIAIPPVFMTDSNDSRRFIDVCVGLPSCSSAQSDTRELAKNIAALNITKKTIHISGCAKGCARSTPADIMITGNQGAYNVGYSAKAADFLERSSLAAADVLAMVAP